MFPKTVPLFAAIVSLFCAARLPAQTGGVRTLKVSATAPTTLQREMAFWSKFRDKHLPAFKTRTKGQQWSEPAAAWLVRALSALSQGALPDEAAALMATFP